MPIVPDHQEIDWDALFTLLLTLLVIGLGIGLPMLISYLHALRTASASICDTRHGSSLLVFGKRLRRGVVDSDYRGRLDKTLELMAQDPKRTVILLGGSPRSEHLSEAMAGLSYLKAKGIEHGGTIQLEERSRNTLENLRQARQMLQSTNSGPTVLITNRYHLARSRMIANSLGLKHILCPAEARFVLTPAVVGRLAFEAFYILWFTTGKSWARMIGSERMLKRVT
ncbi:MAG: YdcF family protein [Pseudomonadota bacterium]